MWPFGRQAKQLQSKAAFIAPLLIDVCRETSPTLLRSLLGAESSTKNPTLLQPILIEELAFLLHLTDRLIFAHCGVNQRALFMEALLPETKRLLESPFDASLADLYNTRQQFYANFYLPDSSENLKDALFWEFGKALAAVYADSNPVAVLLTAKFGAELLSLVDNLLQETEVVQGKR